MNPRPQFLELFAKPGTLPVGTGNPKRSFIKKTGMGEKESPLAN
jgi:hypothetical protein